MNPSNRHILHNYHLIVVALALISSFGMINADPFFGSLTFADYFDGFIAGPDINQYIYGVVPQCIDEVGYHELLIFYKNNIQVYNGNFMTADELCEPPIEVKVLISEGLNYTFFMLDIDAPDSTNPTQYEFVQWGVCNIPGADLARGTDLSNGTVIAPYKPPFTAKGVHRYVFVVFEQRGGNIEVVNQLTTDERRSNFDVRVFASMYRLYQPIASNFMLNQPRD